MLFSFPSAKPHWTGRGMVSNATRRSVGWYHQKSSDIVWRSMCVVLIFYRSEFPSISLHTISVPLLNT